MTLALPRKGLYAITNDLDDDALLAAVQAAIEGGAVLLQYRDKRRSPAQKEALGRDLLQLCHGLGVPLIVNDDIELAARLGADGVHLGRDDAGIAAARAALGPDAIVGVSCYNSLELARRAQSLGASYAAFGRFFPSKSKPDATPASLETLRLAKAELRIPIAAIGGITPANGAPLAAAGADLICAIDGLFGHAEVRRSAQDYAALFR
ncbi:thiamine phosphate synthase [Methylogaea oryzae]|uniref:Thiamine-phosphate synthase n=2 Tax=Methylogaea oryzae TaxID=1295382 RepID=A0A8D4VKA0_9GAMM|nr:thiamine phosphate synthase [Methylogaea oryzae]BBL69653.1 thiamine-phosphate synthase [Methylogaea oryzae]